MIPTIGERVLAVPQRFEYLMNPWDNLNIIGQPPSAAETWLSHDKGHCPWWTEHTAGMPSIGWGEMVVRDGVLVVGPHHWDSGD